MLSTTLLTDLVGRKHDLLVQLYDIGRRQQALVDRGDTAELLKLLAAKQNMISVLQRVEHDMAPFHAENPDARVWPSPNDRARCAVQAAECNRLLEAIVELERRSADRMNTRRDEVAAQLRQVYSAGQAREAYAAQRIGSPIRAIVQEKSPETFPGTAR